MRERSLILVAMSGVRIADPELRALGMTLPGFVERGKVIASLPSLGLLTLAARTPLSWHVELIEVDDLGDDPAACLAQRKPDLVAISSLAARVEEAYAIADRLREAGVPVVLGGLHASVMPDEALTHADAVVAGEGEVVWPRVLEDCAAGTMRGLYRAPLPRFEADDPIPAYELLDLERYNRLTLQTVRGCPLNCDFCAASRLISPVKRKPIALVRRELEQILSLWPQPFIELADDNTFLHKAWSRELVQLIGHYGIRWFTETDLSVADDAALLDALAESGCAQVLIGLESTSHASLAHVDPRGWKLRQREHYLSKIDRIQSAGISVNGCFVLGFDEDGPEVFAETLEFVRAARLSEVQVTILTPFPGTAAYARLRSEGRILPEATWSQCTLFDVMFRPAQMSPDELRNGFRWLVSELYSDEETKSRRARFAACMREGLRARRGRSNESRPAKRAGSGEVDEA